MSRLPHPPPEKGQPDLLGQVTPAERRFAEWDAANPQVWEMFVRCAEDRIRMGYQHYSARDILAYMRWNTGTAGDDGWKLNNNISSFFARKWRLLGMHPELPDFFQERRAPKADKEMVHAA